MTDRIFALSVALDENMREDDVRPLADAISQLRGVLSVGLHVAGIDQWTADERARSAYFQKIYEVLMSKLDGN